MRLLGKELPGPFSSEASQVRDTTFSVISQSETQTSEVSTDDGTRDHANPESDSPTQVLCQTSEV